MGQGHTPTDQTKLQSHIKLAKSNKKLSRQSQKSYEVWKKHYDTWPMDTPRPPEPRTRASIQAIEDEYNRWKSLRAQERAQWKREKDKKRKQSNKSNKSNKSVYPGKLWVRKSKIVTSYKIPKGSSILVPAFFGGKTEFWTEGFRVSDTVPIKTSKDVVYVDGDVLYNPVTKNHKSTFPMSAFDGQEWRAVNYFCFALPNNERDIPVIFADVDSVEIIHDEVVSTK